MADGSVSSWVFPGTGRPAFPPALPLQAAFLLPQCLMPGHTATEYAIHVGDMPPRPHPPRAAPRPQRLRLPRPPFRPSCLSVFTLRMASNKCCPWRPGSGSAASVSYTLGAAKERGPQTHRADAPQADQTLCFRDLRKKPRGNTGIPFVISSKIQIFSVSSWNDYESNIRP